MTKPINRENDPRWDCLQAYVRGMADTMGLTLWQLTVEHIAPEGEQTICDVYVPDASVKSTLRFSDQFFEFSPEKQRRSVTHEMLHLLQATPQRMIESDVLREMMTPREYKMFCYDWNCANEKFIDALAGLVAERFPLLDLEIH
jgi:hypothetical protein